MKGGFSFLGGLGVLATGLFFESKHTRNMKKTIAANTASGAYRPMNMEFENKVRKQNWDEWYAGTPYGIRPDLVEFFGLPENAAALSLYIDCISAEWTVANGYRSRMYLGNDVTTHNYQKVFYDRYGDRVDAWLKEKEKKQIVT